MSEELKQYVEEALYKWIKKQMDEGNFKANLRIEIDTPIEIKGMKGRVVGEILFSEQVPERLPMVPIELPKKVEAKDTKQGEGQANEEMSLTEVDKLLRSLGV